MKNFLSSLFIFAALAASATHNRAGEITYRWISGYTYEATITTYTVVNAPADRCQLEIDWGDGTNSLLSRSNGPVGQLCQSPITSGENIGNNIRKNVYKGLHTYQAPGYYTLSMQDRNRNGGVMNIPNSIDVPFYITTTLLINPSLGPNNSPELLNPPVDEGCINRLFIHNPAAFDVDGDSLHYELVDCRGQGGVPITQTYSPQFVQDPVTIEEFLGDFTWDTPKLQGEFNFAFTISEFRKAPNGRWVLMGVVTRDMQVNIKNCNNRPPVIDPVGPFCVEAGDQLQFTVNATDPDNDNLKLTALGGPFEVTPAATFTAPAQGQGSISGQFTWNTQCSNVRQQPYTVTFKAEDLPPPNETSLSAQFTVPITVVAPPPQNPTATPDRSTILLEWEYNVCQQAVRYDIYRRENLYGFIPDECETGVPEYTGYQLIGSRNGWTNRSYLDNDPDLKFGMRYCYMVVAVFPDGAESYASVEFCTQLPRYLPVITNVDVDSTDVANGRMIVKWTPPKEIDSALFPPPYAYRLERANGIGGNNFTPLFTTNDFTDTTAIDTDLNTQDGGFNYRVAFLYDGGIELAGNSTSASSPFLVIEPRNRANLLRIDANVPWFNADYIILREDLNNPGQFDTITISQDNPHLDTGLVNGQEYCYFVTTIGGYTATGYPDSLVNRSQIACMSPMDTIPPCPPALTFDVNCEEGTIDFFWDPDLSENCEDDIAGYNLYFKSRKEDEWPEEPLERGINSTSFNVNRGTVVGCYAITAYDKADEPNESDFSNVICIDGCPAIRLPNVFTPNGDGLNDFFHPKRIDGNPIFNDIDQFNIQVYNRWGNLVYESNDVMQFVEIGWDGRDKSTGATLPEGVYFYVLRYVPLTLSEPKEEILKGFVHLSR